MQKNILYKTPVNSRFIELSKNNSYNNINPKSDDKIIYKIRERLLTPKSLSILLSNRNNSKFNSNFHNYKSNYNYMINTLLSNDVELNEEKNFGLKSLDNLFTNIKNIKNSSLTKNKFFVNKKKDEKKYEFIIPNLINKEKKYVIKKTPLSLHKKIFSEKENNKTLRYFIEKKSEEKYKNLCVNLKLANQILKLNRIKLKHDKKIIKDLLPMKLDKNYDDFIQRKIILNYNPNFNSPKIHRMSINYMLEQITRNNLRTNTLFDNRRKLEEFKKEKKIKLERELAREMLDKFEDVPVDFYKFKKSIRIFLIDETKLNQEIEMDGRFYDILENKINFLYDCLRLPVIRNNLHKEIMNIQVSKDKEWTKLNTLGNFTLVYLNKLKFNYQKEIDGAKEEDKNTKIKFFEESTKLEDKNKNKKSDENLSTIDYVINILKNEEKCIKEKLEEKQNEGKKYKNEEEDLYNLEEFFFSKSSPYKKIDFANEKLSHIVFHNKKFNILETKKLPKVKNDNKRSSNVFI